MRTIHRRKARRVRETVTIPRARYERLLRQVAEAKRLPELPEADESGHVPAAQFLRASIARDLVRRRTREGLSQQQLAMRAGVRQETISRIESGKHTVTERTLTKIIKALDSA